MADLGITRRWNLFDSRFLLFITSDLIFYLVVLLSFLYFLDWYTDYTSNFCNALECCEKQIDFILHDVTNAIKFHLFVIIIFSVLPH